MYGYRFTSDNYTFVAAGSSYPIDDYSPDIFYSIRLGSSTYSGALVKVRRSSDSAEKDFYPDGSNELSMSSEDGAGTSLSTWISTDTGYVVKWYNQGTGGSSYDASQSTAAAQPILVNAGTIVTQGGKTAIQLRKAGRELITDTALDFTAQTHFGVQTINTSSSDATFLMPFSCDTTGSVYHSAASNGSAVAPYSNYTLPNWYADGTEITATVTRDNIYDNLADNTQHLLSVLNGGKNLNLQMTLNYYAGGVLTAGNAQEFWIFDSDASSDQTDIESDINSYYSIW